MMAVVRLETGDHQPENGFVSSETTSTGLLSRIDGSVLPFLGGFGKYQKQLVVLTWIPALFIGFSQFSDYFLLAQPNNTCVHPTAETRNLTENFTSSLNYTNGSTAAPYSISNVTHSDSKSINCSCMAWNYELQMGLVQNVVTKWNLVCGSERKVHIAKFSLLVGSIFGYLVLGVLADWFGRRPVLITSVLFVLVFGLAVAFSVNVPMFSTLRFFEGFCLAGITLSLYVLRIELCLPLWRFRVTMVANFVVLAGQLLMPGLAALCRDWQVLQAVIICPLVLMLSYIWIFPESLRWLLSTQQYCRAKRQMFRIAKKNKVGETDADEVFAEIQRETQSKPKKTCIVKMVGTRTLWKNIVVLCVNSLTGYGIHHCFARSMIDPEAGATTMFQSFYTDYFMMAGIAVASCMALCPVVEFMGRRGGLLAFMIITALASLLQLGLLNLLGKYSMQLNIEQSETLNKKFSIAFSIIGMFSSHAVSNLSIFFCAEITPTVIRGGGLGLVLASAGFGMLTAPIMELHDQKGYFLHHIIFACCTLICIICILLLPETRYQPLPETIGDGEAYTRQPQLPPKKPGEQDPLLTKLDPAGGQETALGGADNPPSAGDVNAAPPCGVEDEVPCIVIPPPCTMDDAAAEPIALDTIIPTAADSISLCATPPATDTTDSKTTDTESPTAAEVSPPGITDSALPIAADAIPPCVTDTPPTTATDPTPLSKDAELPRTTDTASPPATDTTNSKTTDTALPTTTDTTNDKTIDIELPTATDTTNSKTNDVELPAATDTTNSKTTDVELPTTTDTTNGKITDTALPTTTDTTNGKITDTALPTATDTTNGKTTDTALPTATDTTNSKITDTALPTATDTTNGKTTDTLSTTATDVKPPCITDAAPHAATDTTDPRIPDTSPSADKDDAPVHATDAAQPTTVDSISGSNDGTPPAGATDATPPAAPPLCTIDAVAPPPPDTEPTANSKAPCSMDVSPTGPAPSPSSVPANDAPPSPTDSVSPTTTDPDRAIPVNGTASGVRSS